MKFYFRLFPILFLLVTFEAIHAQKTYTLLSKKTGRLNYSLINSLPPSLKALAAFYSALGGTNCADQRCELTTALGLGNQGSPAQKELISKYFPGDKVANLLIGQDCYLSPCGSSSFSNFVFLSFTEKGVEVEVNYELDVLNHGNVKKIFGPDIYMMNNQTYKNKKRVLYAWADK